MNSNIISSTFKKALKKACFYFVLALRPQLAGTIACHLKCALVAQLDRVLDYESRGREFESSRVRHFP